MPWAKRGAPACCLFCRVEYTVTTYYLGPTWHHCPEAFKRQKEIKKDYNRSYYRLLQDGKGKVVTRRSEIKGKRPTRPSERRRAEELKGVYLKPEYHRAPCGHLTINRFNCPQCLDRFGNTFSDAIIEPGYSRRMGTTGRS